MSFRSSWFIVLFKPFISLLISYLFVLSIISKCGIEVFVDLFISPLILSVFAACVLRTLLLNPYMFVFFSLFDGLTLSSL